MIIERDQIFNDDGDIALCCDFYSPFWGGANLCRRHHISGAGGRSTGNHQIENQHKIPLYTICSDRGKEYLDDA